jgi:hypothetical protein
MHHGPQLMPKFSFVALLAVLCAKSALASSVDCFEELGRGQPCAVTIGVTPVTIQDNGLLTLPGNKRLQLRLPKDFYVQSLNYDHAADAGLLVLDISDNEVAATLIVLVEPTELKIKWSTKIPAFNASPPLISGQAIYLGAIGTVAKLRLSDGRLLWMQKGLYESDTQAFNSFVRPRKEASTVIFTESKVGTAKYKGIREVRVDDLTGKVLNK